MFTIQTRTERDPETGGHDNVTIENTMDRPLAKGVTPQYPEPAIHIRVAGGMLGGGGGGGGGG